MTEYRVVVGLNYGDRRAEPGDIVDDIPAKSLAWLLHQGCIEVVPEVTVQAGVAETSVESNSANGGD